MAGERALPPYWRLFWTALPIVVRGSAWQAGRAHLVDPVSRLPPSCRLGRALPRRRAPGRGPRPRPRPRCGAAPTRTHAALAGPPLMVLRSIWTAGVLCARLPPPPSPRSPSLPFSTPPPPLDPPLFPHSPALPYPPRAPSADQDPVKAQEAGFLIQPRTGRTRPRTRPRSAVACIYSLRDVISRARNAYRDRDDRD